MARQIRTDELGMFYYVDEPDGPEETEIRQGKDGIFEEKEVVEPDPEGSETPTETASADAEVQSTEIKQKRTYQKRSTNARKVAKTKKGNGNRKASPRKTV